MSIPQCFKISRKLRREASTKVQVSFVLNFDFSSKYNFRVRVGETTLEEVKQIHSNDDIGDVESFSSTLGTQWDNPLLINFAGKVHEH